MWFSYAWSCDTHYNSFYDIKNYLPYSHVFAHRVRLSRKTFLETPKNSIHAIGHKEHGQNKSSRQQASSWLGLNVVEDAIQKILDIFTQDNEQNNEIIFSFGFDGPESTSVNCD